MTEHDLETRLALLEYATETNKLIMDALLLELSSRPSVDLKAMAKALKRHEKFVKQAMKEEGGDRLAKRHLALGLASAQLSALAKR